MKINKRSYLFAVLVVLLMAFAVLPGSTETVYAEGGYTVTYHSNYGDGRDETVTAETDMDGWVKISDCAFSLEGMSFTGKWSTQPDGGGDNITPGLYWLFTKNTDLYAQWISGHFITVDEDSLDGRVAFKNLPKSARAGTEVRFEFEDLEQIENGLERILVRYFEDGEEKTLELTTIADGPEPFTVYDAGNVSFQMPDADVTISAVLQDLLAVSPPQPVPLTASDVTLSSSSYTYNGKARMPKVIVKAEGKTLKERQDYKVSYSSGRTNAGKYKVTVTGTGIYTGEVIKAFTIKKAANPLKIKGKTATIKYSKLKKKNRKLAVKKVIKVVKKGKGKLTYKKVSGSKKITINTKTGKVTVKKGLKAGKYKVKVTVKAAGNKNYKASKAKKATFTIVVQ